MVSTLALTRYLNKTLSLRDIPDASKNGLQVRSSKEVKKIGAAVDATIRTFEACVEQGIDFLIVHHGLFWKGQRDDLGVIEKRVKFLKKHGINLYAAHLPLDLHSVYGNNIALCELLGLKDPVPFAEYHGVTIGYKGRTDSDILQIKKLLDKGLKTKVIAHSYGKKRIRSVGIVSGGAFSMLRDALDLDLYVTGEAPHFAGDIAKELKMNVIIGGHYETEMFGVIRLAEMLGEHYGLPHTFLYIPPL